LHPDSQLSLAKPDTLPEGANRSSDLQLAAARDGSLHRDGDFRNGFLFDRVEAELALPTKVIIGPELNQKAVITP
jgi:hypothetical protein